VYKEHNYTIRTSPKNSMNEILFVGWLRTLFLLQNDNLRWKSQYEGPITMFLDGHATVDEHVNSADLKVHPPRSRSPSESGKLSLLMNHSQMRLIFSMTNCLKSAEAKTASISPEFVGQPQTSLAESDRSQIRFGRAARQSVTIHRSHLDVSRSFGRFTVNSLSYDI
jgi:hypothetical protein